MKYLFLIVVFMAAANSCSKDEEPDSQVRLIWKYDLPRSNENALSLPHISGNQVLIGVEGETLTSNDYIHSLNIYDGEKNWEWNDEIPNSNFTIMWRNATTVDLNGVFYFQDGPRTFAVDLQSGSTIWKRLLDPVSNTQSTVDGDLTTDGEFIYNSISPFSGSTSGSILRMDKNTGQGKIVYDVEATGSDDLLLLSSPIFDTNSQGSNLIFNRSSFTNVSTNRQSFPQLVSYNDQNETLNFRVTLDPPLLSNAAYHQPKIWEDKVIVVTSGTVTCSDLNSGEMIWKVPTSGDFLFSDFVIKEGIFYGTHDGDFQTIAIDINSGEVVWRNKIAGSTSIIQYANGYLYFVGGNTGRLHILNSSTGREVFTIDPPNGLNNSFVNVKTDEDSGLMIIQDFTTVYAYSLFKP